MLFNFSTDSFGLVFGLDFVYFCLIVVGRFLTCFLARATLFTAKVEDFCFKSFYSALLAFEINSNSS